MINIDKYFFDICLKVAERSDDPNTQVGICVVDDQNNIRATGANTFARRVSKAKLERTERPEKYFWIEHGERNAFYYAARAGVSLEGCRIYLLGLPCMDCARGIIQVGIKECVVHLQKQLAWNTPKYQPDFERVEQMLREAGVAIRLFDYDRYAYPQPAERNCPCWKTGTYQWVAGCEGHSRESVT